MKRYILLAGEYHHPSGWADFVGDFDTLEEARDFFSELRVTDRDVDWGEIVDTETKLLVDWTATLFGAEIYWKNFNKED